MADSKGAGCGLLIVAVLVIGGISALFNGGDDSSSSSSSGSSGSSSHKASTPDPDDPDVIGDEVGAISVCRTFVERRLRSPASADYNDENGNHVQGAVWLVTGTVDSDNAFGAAMRNNYTCKVRFTGDDNWRLVALQGLTN